jgi:hypothetical protein
MVVYIRNAHFPHRMEAESKFHWSSPQQAWKGLAEGAKERRLMTNKIAVEGGFGSCF